MKSNASRPVCIGDFLREWSAEHRKVIRRKKTLEIVPPYPIRISNILSFALIDRSFGSDKLKSIARVHLSDFGHEDNKIVREDRHQKNDLFEARRSSYVEK